MIDPALQQTYEKQAGMLANRVKKRYRHLRKRFARHNIEVFRLYDWDIPEIRAVVDWYGGHLVVGEQKLDPVANQADLETQVASARHVGH